MQNVKKLSRTAAVFLLAVLILICSTVLPNTGTTVSAASAELTSIGLAEHALKAYRDGWQYSYGAYGNFNSNGVRASDCSGLIYSYFCWVDDNSNIQPNWNYPRTVTAQANDAVESGPIDTIPRTHGLIVTIANYDHVGVYVGNGMVVDNSTWGVNMRYESIPGHGWLQWHKLGSITYPTTGWYKFDGDYFYYENGEYVINTTRTINGVTYTFGSDGVSDKTPSSANGSFSEADSAFNAKTTAGVRLRKGPGLSYDTITVLAEGTKVNVTSTKNSEWYAVTTASGQKGYVFSEYLNVTGTVNEDDSSDSGSSDNSNTGTNGEAAKTTTGVHLRSGKGTNYSSLFMGLYQPMAEGIGNIDFGVLIPMMLGFIVTVAVCAKIMNRLIQQHYGVLSKFILGFVVSSVLMIVPTSFSGILQLILGILCFAIGFILARMMDVRRPEE